MDLNPPGFCFLFFFKLPLWQDSFLLDGTFTCVAIFIALEWKKQQFSRLYHCGQNIERCCLRGTAHFLQKRNVSASFFITKVVGTFKYLIFSLVCPFTVQYWMDYCFFLLFVFLEKKWKNTGENNVGESRGQHSGCLFLYIYIQKCIFVLVLGFFSNFLLVNST